MTPPLTVTKLLERLIKSASVVKPIFDPVILTFPASISPPVIFPVVSIVLAPTSIEPKPAVIEPELSAPVVTIVFAPSAAVTVALDAEVPRDELSVPFR